MQDSRADWGFPQDMDIWKDIPGNLDAAFMGVGKSGEIARSTNTDEYMNSTTMWLISITSKKQHMIFNVM